MHFCFPQLPGVSGEMCNQHNLSHKIHTTVSVLFVSQKIERDLKMREAKARFKRCTLHVRNLMQMRKIYCFRSFALDSAHVKFDV